MTIGTLAFDGWAVIARMSEAIKQVSVIEILIEYSFHSLKDGNCNCHCTKMVEMLQHIGQQITENDKSITQMSRLSMVELCQSDLQGTPPNRHRQGDRCELDSYNCG